MALAEDSSGSLSSDYEARPQFVDFHQRDKRWAVIVAHRRAGKTVACVMELITRALATPKQNARFAYIAPYREQAKTVAWEYLKRYAECVVKDSEKDIRESDLTVRLYNGSHIRLFGADNPNALRGTYWDGVVMDEYADMRPSLWGEVIRPALSDRQGWAVFIGTPRGHNAFYDKYQEASRADWYRLTLRASETGILPKEELDDAHRTMTDAQFEQEYECSFEAAIIGAIYAKELKAASERVTSVPYDASMLVNTAWDIGIGDATAIWFYQLVGHEVRIIDYFEDSGEAATYYASKLASKGYKYDTAYLPHDAENRDFSYGTTRVEALRQNGLKCEVLPKIKLEDGISSARMLFSRCWFDQKKCERGLEALVNYRWGYNNAIGEIKAAPVHDWSSHGADAFRYLALSIKKTTQQRSFSPPIKYPKLAYA